MVKAIEGIGSLSFLNFEISSADKCCESAADPPLPAVKIFPPKFNLNKIILIISSKLL